MSPVLKFPLIKSIGKFETLELYLKIRRRPIDNAHLNLELSDQLLEF